MMSTSDPTTLSAHEGARPFVTARFSRPLSRRLGAVERATTREESAKKIHNSTTGQSGVNTNLNVRDAPAPASRGAAGKLRGWLCLVPSVSVKLETA